ncbi:MAG: hypothetical protein ACK4M0_14640 [Phreatobacter sp.]
MPSATSDAAGSATEGCKKPALDLCIAAAFWLRKNGSVEARQCELLAAAERQIERPGRRPAARAP